MNTPAPYGALALLVLGMMAPLSAQNFSNTGASEIRPLAVDDLEGADHRHFDGSALPGSYEVPVTKAAATLNEGTLYVSQDLSTLDARQARQRDVDSVVDLGVLKNPIRKVAVAAGSVAIAKSLPANLALISATYRAPSESAATVDCPVLGMSVSQRVKMDPSLILEIVEAEVAANPSCACEIVKASLAAIGATPDQTAQVVETAILAAPDSMRLVSQCAIAAVPESLAAVQTVLAKLDPASGESGSSKSGKEVISSKSGKEVIPPPPPVIGNPLDLPPIGPPLPPPPVYPPSLTEVDSRS